MPAVFSKDINDTDKLRKEHDAEKEELIKQIGQLSVENAWLKNLLESVGHETKKGLIDPTSQIPVKRQCKLLGISRSTAYYHTRVTPSPKAADDYTNLIKSIKIKINMNGRGRSTDNAITERFIRSLKQERLYLDEYENSHQLR